jgi:26S proteasome regulatory subunit T3
MYVRVLSILDREKLKPNCSIAIHRYSNAIVDILPSESDSGIQMMKVSYRGSPLFLDDRKK